MLSPGTFVQAFLTSWQKSRGWTGSWLYLDAMKLTTEFAKQRWNTPGTEPKLELRHLNNQIAHVSVRCSNKWAELPAETRGSEVNGLAVLYYCWSLLS